MVPGNLDRKYCLPLGNFSGRSLRVGRIFNNHLFKKYMGCICHHHPGEAILEIYPIHPFTYSTIPTCPFDHLFSHAIYSFITFIADSSINSFILIHPFIHSSIYPIDPFSDPSIKKSNPCIPFVILKQVTKPRKTW